MKLTTLVNKPITKQEKALVFDKLLCSSKDRSSRQWQFNYKNDNPTQKIHDKTKLTPVANIIEHFRRNLHH